MFRFMWTMEILSRMKHVPLAFNMFKSSLRTGVQPRLRERCHFLQETRRQLHKKHALFPMNSSFSPFNKNVQFFSKSLPAVLRKSGCGFADKKSLWKPAKRVFESSDTVTADIVLQNFELHENLVSEEEENWLLEEVDNYLEDLDYEYDHWDNAIHGYRETEKSQWSEKSQAILRRIRQVAFSGEEEQLNLVHVLDLAADGYIKPHVDSVKFCGSTITGLNLLSTAIMRLVKHDYPQHWVNVVLKPRSLYIIRDVVRYQFTHEILMDSESSFRGQRIPRARRISIICRNEPS